MVVGVGGVREFFWKPPVGKACCDCAVASLADGMGLR